MLLEAPEGFTSVIHVHWHMKGLKIAEGVMAATGIPIKDQLLYCHDKRLTMHKSLIQQHIQAGDKITVCVKLSGGSGEHDSR